MRMFIVFTCLALLAIVRADDDAAKAKDAANKAMDDAKLAVDAAKAVNKENKKDGEETAKQAEDAAKAAKDEAKEAKAAAKDAAANAKTDAQKKEADAAATAASNANQAAAVASAAASAAVFAECKPRKPHAVPAYHFIHSENEPPNEKEIEKEYTAIHSKEVKAALDEARKLRKSFQVAKKAGEAAGNSTTHHHQRYLRTYESLKRNSGEVCYLFYGFRHLHIPRIRCKPEDAKDCHGKEKDGMKVYSPAGFIHYSLYADCIRKNPKNPSETQHPQKIMVKVATKCACEVHACTKH